MKFSDEIDQIGAALAKAQAEFPAVKKGKTATITSTKGSYSYSYADLGDVIDATRPILNKHEIAVLQSLGNGTVETLLVHSSGQWILGDMDWSLENLSAQAAGSAVTYGRRYHYSPMVGVVTEEDNDGKGGTDAPVVPPRSRTAPRSAPRTPPSAEAEPVLCSVCGERETTKVNDAGEPECPSCTARKSAAGSPT